VSESLTDLDTDVTLVYPLNSHHQLKEDFLADAETRENRAYKTDHHAQGLAFAPLPCNSFGQQGPDLLRYLWLIAALMHSGHAWELWLSCANVPS
jgi:hypothetical protein